MMGGLLFPFSKKKKKKTFKFLAKRNYNSLLMTHFVAKFALKSSIIEITLQSSKYAAGFLDNSNSENHPCWWPFCR